MITPDPGSGFSQMLFIARRYQEARAFLGQKRGACCSEALIATGYDRDFFLQVQIHDFAHPNWQMYPLPRPDGASTLRQMKPRIGRFPADADGLTRFRQSSCAARHLTDINFPSVLKCNDMGGDKSQIDRLVVGAG